MQTGHNLSSRLWPQQIGAVNRTTVSVSWASKRTGGSTKYYTPVVYMNYRVGNVEYHDIRLTNQMSRIQFAKTVQDAEQYVQTIYPVGRKMTILVDPDHPAAPRMEQSIVASIPWADLLLVFAVYGGGLITLFIIKTLALKSNDGDDPDAPSDPSPL